MEMDDNIGLNGMTQKDPVRVRDVVTCDLPLECVTLSEFSM